MPHDQGSRESPTQVVKQFAQGLPLGFRPGIHRGLPVVGKPTDVTDPDAVPVVETAMGAYPLDGPALLHRSIGRDDEVVSASFPAQGAMPVVDIRQSKGTAPLVGGAMHDNQRDGSHPSKPLVAKVVYGALGKNTAK